MENKKINNNESIFQLINDGLKELWEKKWKFMFVVIYDVVAFFVWNIACALYELSTFNELPELFYKVVSTAFYSIIIAVIVLLLLQVIIIIGKSAYAKLKKVCNKGFKDCGLKNQSGETPTLKSICKDVNKEYGLILKVKNFNIPLTEFYNKIQNLELVVKGQIYNMDYANNTDFTLISVLPNEYVTSYKIDVNDDKLSSMDNCLIVGQTGSRQELHGIMYTW
jgi:hypothetical protein